MDGTVDFEDVVDGASRCRSRTDEATGITKRVVIDWRASARSQDLKPAIIIKEKGGKIAKMSKGGEARYMLSVDAILSVDRCRQPSRPAMCSRVFRWKPPRLVTSPAVCRGLPSCSKPAVRRTMRSLQRSMVRSEFGRDYKNKRRIIIDPSDESEDRTSRVS